MLRIFQPYSRAMKRINSITTLYCLSVINLLMMYYTIVWTCEMEKPLVFIDFIDNLSGVMLEVLFLTGIISVFVRKRVSVVQVLCFFITGIWAFANIVYSRFFGQYIPLSAFGESGNMLDKEMLKCLVSGLMWSDLYFVVVGIIVAFWYLKLPPVPIQLATIYRGIVFSLMIVLMDLLMHFVLNPTIHIHSYFATLRSELFSSWRYTCQPLYANFQRGSMRSVSFSFIESFLKERELSETQKAEIHDEMIKLRPMQLSDCRVKRDIKNVIVLLVESYMSFSVNMKIGGKEVTPFLNSLARDSSVLYNGRMTSNITVGESSDGQFIYMTGLLPLRSEITISEARKRNLQGLPGILAREKGMETRMIVPTSASFWSQDVMCERYGIKQLYSRNDYSKPHDSFLSDKQIFELAAHIDAKSRQPFFSIILTYSMHVPYVDRIDSTFNVYDETFSPTMNYYLNACHFMDTQMREYFESLKRNDLYENSMIVIVSDHHVSKKQLELPSRISERELPLFIVNSGLSRSQVWAQECNQLDVYTTLLDMLGIDNAWMGLGHTLLTDSYEGSVSPKTWELSEWIITSGY